MERLREYIVRRAREHIEEYMVDGVVVETVIDDGVLEDILLDVLSMSGRPLSWRELVELFRGVAGEERLRKIIKMLMGRGVVRAISHLRFELARPPSFNHRVGAPLVGAGSEV